MQAGGIDPDILVPQLSDADYKDRRVVREADLRRHLLAQAKVEDKLLEGDNSPDPRFSAKAEDLEKKGIKDFQLYYALNTLKRLASPPALASSGPPRSLARSRMTKRPPFSHSAADCLRRPGPADRTACSAGLLGGALGSQYLGGLHPCEMCYWQRWPHGAASAASGASRTGEARRYSSQSAPPNRDERCDQPGYGRGRDPAALGWQYLGGLHPCEMCYWQRWPLRAASAAVAHPDPQLVVDEPRLEPDRQQRHRDVAGETGDAGLELGRGRAHGTTSSGTPPAWMATRIGC